MSVRLGLVVDASVLVARVRRTEDHHEQARTLLTALVAKGVVVHAPAIAFAEIASAISRGSGSIRWALRAVADLRDLPGLQITAVDERLGRVAAQLAAENRLRGCDAIYTALAYVHGVDLVTLDREQRERAPAGLVVLSPAEALARWS